MGSLFVGNGMWQLVRQSDAMSYLVLGTLLMMSIICWSIFFYKLIISVIRRQQLYKGIATLSETKSVEQLRALATSGALGVVSSFLAQLLPSGASGGVSSEQVDCAIESVLTDEESGMGFLSTSAAVSPLLGLFGTVWGLVNAFMRISQEQTADITVVAPGISQALVTTLAGLMVAIPALVMYNVLLSRVNRTERLLVQLANQASLILGGGLSSRVQA